jgi:hypothetical protein
MVEGIVEISTHLNLLTSLPNSKILEDREIEILNFSADAQTSITNIKEETFITRRNLRIATAIGFPPFYL